MILLRLRGRNPQQRQQKNNLLQQEELKMTREREEWAHHLQYLRNTNVQLTTSMANTAMSHVKHFKPIQDWLKAYNEYAVPE